MFPPGLSSLRCQARGRHTELEQPRLAFSEESVCYYFCFPPANPGAPVIPKSALDLISTLFALESCRWVLNLLVLAIWLFLYRALLVADFVPSHYFLEHSYVSRRLRTMRVQRDQMVNKTWGWCMESQSDVEDSCLLIWIWTHWTSPLYAVGLGSPLWRMKTWTRSSLGLFSVKTFFCFYKRRCRLTGFSSVFQLVLWGSLWALRWQCLLITYFLSCLNQRL